MKKAKVQRHADSEYLKYVNDLFVTTVVRSSGIVRGFHRNLKNPRPSDGTVFSSRVSDISGRYRRIWMEIQEMISHRWTILIFPSLQPLYF